MLEPNERFLVDLLSKNLLYTHSRYKFVTNKEAYISSYKQNGYKIYTNNEQQIAILEPIDGTSCTVLWSLILGLIISKTINQLCDCVIYNL